MEIKSGKDFVFFVSRKLAEKQYELIKNTVDSISDELKKEPSVNIIAVDATTKNGVLIASVPEESRQIVEGIIRDKSDEFKARYGKPGVGAVNIGKAIKGV